MQVHASLATCVIFVALRAEKLGIQACGLLCSRTYELVVRSVSEPICAHIQVEENVYRIGRWFAL